MIIRINVNTDLIDNIDRVKSFLYDAYLNKILVGLMFFYIKIINKHIIFIIRAEDIEKQNISKSENYLDSITYGKYTGKILVKNVKDNKYDNDYLCRLLTTLYLDAKINNTIYRYIGENWCYENNS